KIDECGKASGLTDDVVKDEENITNDFEKKVDINILKRALNQLNGREKKIMELRFGLVGEKEKTQKDVADLLGISQSYISRLEKKIIKRLKKEFNKMV